MLLTCEFAAIRSANDVPCCDGPIRTERTRRSTIRLRGVSFGLFAAGSYRVPPIRISVAIDSRAEIRTIYMGLGWHGIFDPRRTPGHFLWAGAKVLCLRGKSCGQKHR